MNQKGFTLIELLVAVAILGIVVVGIVSSIFQIVQGGTQIAGKSVALADIDNAAHWLTRDIVMGQSTDLVYDDPPTGNMTMTWNDLTGWAEAEESISHSAVYTHSGTQLLREYDSANNTTIVGRHLTDVGFSIDIDGNLVTVTLTSSPDGVRASTVTRKYLIRMRTESSP
jgi:prepilin-type N-terminal cleavage/methylation domain-containing protein